MRPFCVGLTGGVAAGKSTVAALLQRLGAAVVDTDQIARSLTGPGGAAMPAIIAAFGSDCLAADGGLDRSAMRALVFADGEARRRLEAILHPLILGQARARLERLQAPYAVLVVPLLAEHWTDWRGLIDRVLVVDCPPALQLKRLIRRDGVDEHLARAMLAAQAGRAQRLALADDVLENQEDLSTLEGRVRELHSRYLGLARSRMHALRGPD